MLEFWRLLHQLSKCSHS